MTEPKSPPARPERKPGDPEPGMLSRRKLLYVAPALLSAGMMHRAASCGQMDPRQFQCQMVPRSS
jgi:hypothetical protein